ncbi:ribosomal protein S11 (apicoplast) [Toxoplasma gondii TgCatPRC2]|uniref:Ribosomal protein S11 n=13 Tax=Toxoplasma gondii TaxID=5811 RepID=Q9XQQ4_TOXGO|nr:ribosomal protein S11 [Toxoplasma gondii RH]AAD41156.1 ribosomal protein S11 [Toxoplasma gondii]EPT24391.1 ribosomal protein S11 [Toxoplasma gondii ME49]KFG27516.1 ribosomal protein S11 [Toxoplasma gondii p89]KFG27544.1 ribosomal protein S11 [Toxoplasma gondii FOU]KFG49801.1 ribosomal protein S11 [Toxoplasma gondii RUB]KFG99163.1 ribosomal protein S11 [Toxoplasma gondii MAS]KYF38391.1 ribosomal protein S11 [Toxoplasma gondii ARI]KYK53915.1 ribosomal protein S11 [Toxoplasma gondii TgCatPR|eukprot:NP_044556.1 ribosomal protein S11 (apicoplast) [Toxoplasma gondii RH]
MITNKIFTLYIKSTGKNTFLSLLQNNLIFNTNKLILDKKQNILNTYSCGNFGFKNRKKETAFACSFIVTKILLLIINLKIKFFHIVMKGIGLYRKIILTTILTFLNEHPDLKLLSITDLTQSSFNGCSSKKRKKH